MVKLRLCTGRHSDTDRMANLIFHAGTMNAGKSTLALQMHHARTSSGLAGVLYTRHDRSGPARISSRLGASCRAVEVSDRTDLYRDVVRRLSEPAPVDYVVCDEVQFYTPVQIEQAADIVDRLNMDVYLFGILTDFRGRLFPSTARAVELANHVVEAPVKVLCWCGDAGTHQARLVDGRMVFDGDLIVVGDTSDRNGRNDPVTYEVLCRKHHRMMAPNPNGASISLGGVSTRF